MCNFSCIDDVNISCFIAHVQSRLRAHLTHQPNLLKLNSLKPSQFNPNLYGAQNHPRVTGSTKAWSFETHSTCPNGRLHNDADKFAQSPAKTVFLLSGFKVAWRRQHLPFLTGALLTSCTFLERMVLRC